MFVSDERVSTAAELLRSARELAGLSQTELGQRAGVPRTMVSAYERDLRQPSLATLRRLLWAAGFELRMQLVRYSDPDEFLRAMEEQFTGSPAAAQETAESAQARERRAAAERARQNKRHQRGWG